MYLILKRFNSSRSFEIPTRTELNIEQQEIKNFHIENEYVFCYLVDEGYIKHQQGNSYSLEIKGIIFLKNWRNWIKIFEYYVEDYPTLLGGIIGGIIGSVITFIITK
ncbi:MAG: hypothetical protein NT085_05385 [candidate division SR1 bacterium]|nr:hypothetical protein [candidate division SR1 bacterium]